MAPPVLHLLPAAGGLLRAQHVCGGGGGELPQVNYDIDSKIYLKTNIIWLLNMSF